MSQIKIGDLIDLSIERTKDVFFRPFSVKRLVKMVFIAWLAGALGGGGGNFDIPTNWNSDSEAWLHKTKQVIITSIGNQSTVHAQDEYDYNQAMEAFESGQDQYYSERGGASSDNPFKNLDGVGVGVIIAGFMFFMVITILFMWIGCRFKFIWYNAVVNQTDAISAPWSHYKPQGNSLFGFYLLWMIAGFVFFGIIAAWAFLPANAAGVFDDGYSWSFGAFFKFFGFPILVLIFFAIAMSIFYHFIEQFVVAIMAEKEISFTEAWREFTELYSARTKKMWIYILLSMAFGMVIGIITAILIILGLIVVLIVGAIVFGLLYLIFGLLLGSQLIFGIMAVLLGIPFVVAVIFFFNGLAVPFCYFFRTFSLYFLTHLNAGYQPLNLVMQDDTETL